MQIVWRNWNQRNTGRKVRVSSKKLTTSTDPVFLWSCIFSLSYPKTAPSFPLSSFFWAQVRIDRRPTVRPTSEMITLSVHWREQLARRRLPEIDRPRSKYACTRVENEIRAVSGPDKVHYLISTLLVRYWYIICNRTLELKISYSLLDSNLLTYPYYLHN